MERGISSRGPSAPFLTFLEPRFRRRRTALRSGSDCEPPICASRTASSASSAAAGGASRRRRRRTLLLLRSLRASAPPPPRSGDSSLLLPPTGVSAVRGAARAESAVARFRPGAMPAERKGSFPAGGFREAGANRCGYGSSRRCEFNGSAILAAAVILLAILAFGRLTRRRDQGGPQRSPRRCAFSSSAAAGGAGMRMAAGGRRRALLVLVVAAAAQALPLPRPFVALNSSAGSALLLARARSGRRSRRRSCTTSARRTRDRAWPRVIRSGVLRAIRESQRVHPDRR